MGSEEIIKLLLQRRGPSEPELTHVLHGVNPPELCRVSLALLSANYRATLALEKRMEEYQTSQRQWWSRVANGVVVGVTVTIFLSVGKALGWIP